MDLVNLIGGVILLFISFCMYIIELGENKSVKKNNIKNINIKTGGSYHKIPRRENFKDKLFF